MHHSHVCNRRLDSVLCVISCRDNAAKDWPANYNTSESRDFAKALPHKTETGQTTQRVTLPPPLNFFLNVKVTVKQSYIFILTKHQPNLFFFLKRENGLNADPD